MASSSSSPDSECAEEPTTPGTGNGARLSRRAGCTRFNGRSLGTMPPIGTPTKMFCTISTNATSAVKIPPVAGTASGFRIFSNVTAAREHMRRKSAHGAPDRTARIRMRTARSTGGGAGATVARQTAKRRKRSSCSLQSSQATRCSRTTLCCCGEIAPSRYPGR